jgi:hypothetical protein
VLDPATVSYILSSVASVGKIFESVFKLRESGIIPNAAQYEAIEREANSQPSKTVSVADQIVMRATVSDELIEVLGEEIQKIKGRMKDIYTNTGSGSGLTSIEKQKETDACRREFCWNLQQIRRHNGGNLPPDMQRDWDVNLCATYKFI